MPLDSLAQIVKATNVTSNHVKTMVRVHKRKVGVAIRVHACLDIRYTIIAHLVLFVCTACNRGLTAVMRSMNAIK